MKLASPTPKCQWLLGNHRMRRVVLAIASTTIALKIMITSLIWLIYPHVTLRIFNETPSAICGVFIDFFYGKRTAERIGPGDYADTEFQLFGGGTVSMSYQDSTGAQREELIYGCGEYSPMPRGSMEVHVTAAGLSFVNRTYTALEIPGWTLYAWPTGQMAVSGDR
jgi:hypothetical protein